MELHYQEQGSGPALIILHGLLGSGDNWRSTARWLGDRFRVFTPDLRNHGRSPHGERMDFPALAADLREFMERHSLERTLLMGHSLGGKLAMWFSLAWPQMVEKLVVVDIAPRPYGDRHGAILQALLDLEPARYRERGEIELGLRSAIPDESLRLFLLKSLVRIPDGGYRWGMGLENIARAYRYISDWPPTWRRSQLPALFVRGQRSDYLLERDEPLLRHYFPSSRMMTILGAGHWPHVEAPEPFREALRDFLEDRDRWMHSETGR